MYRISVPSVSLAAMLVVAAATAHADVVFSNVTSTSDVNNSTAVCGSKAPPCPNPVGGLIDAEAFTPSADFTMTDAQVLVIVAVGAGGDSDFNVFLYSNASGVPGSLIEQIGFDVAATTTFPGSMITANSIATPITLTSGTEYWLVLGPADSDSFVGWENGGSPSVPFAYSGDGGTSWGTDTAADQFEIDGTPVTASVPEPSSLFLLTTVGLLLFLGGAKLSARHTARIGS
jgi:hypothetical protein